MRDGSYCNFLRQVVPQDVSGTMSAACDRIKPKPKARRHRNVQGSPEQRGRPRQVTTPKLRRWRRSRRAGPPEASVKQPGSSSRGYPGALGNHSVMLADEWLTAIESRRTSIGLGGRFPLMVAGLMSSDTCKRPAGVSCRALANSMRLRDDHRKRPKVDRCRMPDAVAGLGLRIHPNCPRAR